MANLNTMDQPCNLVLYIVLSQFLVFLASLWFLRFHAARSRPNSALGGKLGLQKGSSEKVEIHMGPSQILAQAIAGWKKLGSPEMLLTNVKVEQTRNDL